MYLIKESDWSRYRHGALDHGLNVAVLHIARKLLPGGFEVSDEAPDSYEAIVRQFESGKRYVVYAGGSANTIFGDPEVNYHFRAWHDWCHWKGSYDFSFQGEYGVFTMQCNHLMAVYGPGEATSRWKRILFADIIGQKLYFQRYHRFPADQMAFVLRFLEKQETAAQYQSTPLASD